MVNTVPTTTQPPDQPTHREALLEVKGLRTHFFTAEGVVTAVDGVDLVIQRIIEFIGALPTLPLW
nr:hypothetical protein [Chloroflexia bacterium]